MKFNKAFITLSIKKSRVNTKILFMHNIFIDTAVVSFFLPYVNMLQNAAKSLKNIFSYNRLHHLKQVFPFDLLLNPSQFSLATLAYNYYLITQKVRAGS